MPAKTDPEPAVRKALATCRRAVRELEATHGSLLNLYWLFKKAPGDHRTVVARLDRSTDTLEDALPNLRDVAFQMEKLLES